MFNESEAMYVVTPIDGAKQKEYEERTKAKKKAEMVARKKALRAEDVAKGVFIPVSLMQKSEPKIAKRMTQ
jgi:hypothetical protein